MKPVGFKQQNVVFAKDQPEYLPLPAFTDQEITTSCWKLSAWERVILLFTGKIWLQQMNFGGPLQPQRIKIRSPFGGHAKESSHATR